MDYWCDSDGGFAASIAHPGGNITGFAALDSALGGKWVTLLKEMRFAALRDRFGGIETPNAPLRGEGEVPPLSTSQGGGRPRTSWKMRGCFSMGEARGGVDCSSGDESHLFIPSTYCRENLSRECRP
jgi:hypothetical protein